jgi:hypothetical protein
LVVRVAVPLAIVAEPIDVPLLEKVTVPDGRFVLLPESVATSATLFPATAVLGFAESRIALKMPAPVPLSATVCLPVVSLSVSVTVPLCGPVCVGWKMTLMVQLALPASDEPQLFVCVKPALAAMLVKVIAVVLVLVTVTGCEAEGVLSGWVAM